MGVDMGLQDFRSSNQFWQELGHPEIQRYEDSSDNKWFETDPQLAWGINYSQLRAYREAKVDEQHRRRVPGAPLIYQPCLGLATCRHG